MRIVFFGTPAFAVPSLHALAATPHSVVAVVTQPDRPRGRGHRLGGSAVKDAAGALSIPVLQPEQIKDPAFMAALKSVEPDLGVVAAYGKILPVDLLALPRLGMINVHASLLPRWRGAAPIHRALLAGDTATGVTIMRVVKALDAGPMLAAVETPIEPDETSADLELRLANLGAGLLARTLDALVHGTVSEVAQDAALVTYAARLTRTDSQLDFAQPALAVHNTIRGLHPWPLAAAVLNGRRILLLRSELAPDVHPSDPSGSVVAVEPDALVVATGSGAIRIRRVQLEGRPAVAVRDFLNGHTVRAGDRLARWSLEP